MRQELGALTKSGKTLRSGLSTVVTPTSLSGWPTCIIRPSTQLNFWASRRRVWGGGGPVLANPLFLPGFPLAHHVTYTRCFPHVDILHTRLSMKYTSANALNQCTSLPQINQLLAPLEVGHGGKSSQFCEPVCKRIWRRNLSFVGWEGIVSPTSPMLKLIGFGYPYLPAIPLLCLQFCRISKKLGLEWRWCLFLTGDPIKGI